MAHLLLWAAGWYGLAKVFETFDLAIYRLLGGTLSGHTIKHLLAAGAVFAIVRQLRLRRPLAVWVRLPRLAVRMNASPAIP